MRAAEVVCGLPAGGSLGPSRNVPNVQARQMGMWMFLTLGVGPGMASAYYGRTHATAIHAARKVSDWFDTGDLFAKRLERAVELLTTNPRAAAAGLQLVVSARDHGATQD